VRRSALRWGVAAAVTIAAFTAATWISGALVLTMHDNAVKWGIAGGLGVAAAALAALWGQSYATAEPSAEPEERPLPGPARSSGSSTFTISGGTFNAPVTLAHDIGIINLTTPSPAPAQLPPADPQGEKD
jgi:hypothetical protein